MRSYWIVSLTALFQIFVANGQKSPGELGYRHVEMIYKSDTADVLIVSKKGDEEKPKPLFLFCQGSLPIPSIVYDEHGASSAFPFQTDLLSEIYHLAVISKPGIPVMASVNELNPDYTYADSSGTFPMYYLERNYLDYYVARNTEIIKQLHKKSWITSDQLVVAGHSEGATVAAKLALKNKAVTHLIFASGNPLGRIMSMIGRSRKYENDSTQFAENDHAYWQYLLTQSETTDSVDYYARTDYSFSIPPMEYLKQLKIPVLVTYGSLDYSTPFNDYFRVWCAQNEKQTISFLCYVGLEHNYFGTTPDGKPDYTSYHWDQVATDWLTWLQAND